MGSVIPADEFEAYLEIWEFGHTTLQEWGLTDLGWTFDITNSKERLGVCKHSKKKIEVSAYYVQHIEESKDTILHEIAHALVGPTHGHDNVWRQMCIRVGARPERCAPEGVKTSAKYRYVIKCVNEECPKKPKWYRHRLRRSKHSKTYPFGMCPTCHSVLKAYELVYNK